jgi:ribonuclease HII
MLVIGIDEAGYGPTLGPLVIGGSAWQTEDQTSATFEAFRTGFTAKHFGRIRLDDSKVIYSPSTGIEPLEAGCLASLMLWQRLPDSFRDLLELLTMQIWPADLPWYEHWESKLSVGCEEKELVGLNAAIPPSWRGPAQLLRTSVRIIEPFEFNQLCDTLGNKSTLLTEASLQLVEPLLATNSDTKVEIACDKHGGRNRYFAALAQRWPESSIRILEESRLRSRYAMELDGRQILWSFSAKGDSYVPTSLASLWAKYIRERLMAPFNRYWIERVTGLEPTAGYPVDGARFLQAIEGTRSRIGPELNRIKRNR